MRLAAAFALLCTVALAACSGDDDDDQKQQTCQTFADCPATPRHVCQNNVCIPLCTSDAACGAGKVCEDGICLAPACGGPSDCGAAEACVGGKCAAKPAASEVASCELTPSPAVTHAGATLQLKPIAKNADGKAVPYQTFAFTATGAATVDASSGLVTGAASSGPATITATINGKTCTASITNYGATSGALRVVAIHAHSKAPVVGAKVVLDADTANPAVTDASGIASFAGATGAHDVHIFAAGYHYTSFIQVTSGDLLAPMYPFVPLAQRGGFTGTMNAAAFAPLAEQGQAVHLAFFGSGIPNSILDLSVNTLAGPLRTVNVSLGGQSQAVDLPSGLVLGIGENLFGTEQYKIYADPGKRVLWGLGGNVDVNRVINALSPILTGGSTDIDVGGILPQLLPLFGKLQAGAIVGAEAPPDVASGGTPTFKPVSVALDTPLRLKSTVKVPDLPTLNGAGNYVDGAIAMAGAMAYPLGFVPLGFTAGLSHKVSGKNGPKVLDPNCDTSAGEAICATSMLTNMRLAPMSGGLEGSKFGIVALALNLGGLSTSTSSTIALSGLVKMQDEVKYATGDGPVTDFGRGFLGMHGAAGVTFAKGARTITMNGDADGAVQVYRFEVEDGDLTWNVWMPKAGASTRTVVLPNPTAVDAAFADPVAGSPSGRLLGLQLTGSANSLDALATFGSATLDAIGDRLAAFTALSVATSP